MSSDTIAAIATPAGKGGIGIVRISGSGALAIGEKITGLSLIARQAHYGTFYAGNQQKIDQGIALYFSSPNSFTGEDVVELQAHGSMVVLNLLLQETITLGARLARPGEFSERAFLNNKIDLLQAEAIADIIDSASVAASRSALKSLNGAFSTVIHQLVNDVIQLRVYIEAAIDFPEEEIDFLSDQIVSDSLDKLLNNIRNIIQQARQGAILRSGVQAVIVGKPNAGKSSLLNQLAKDDLAIVNERAGTTRDVLRQQIELEGIPLNIIDTAGLRQSTDDIEQEGIRRIKNEIEKSDIVLYLQDISEEATQAQPSLQMIEQVFTQHDIQLPEKAILFVINNKIDKTNMDAEIIQTPEYCCIAISAKQSMGIDLLAKEIKNKLGLNQTSEDTFTARARHIDALNTAEQFIQQGREQLAQHHAGELLADDLRKAQDKLGEITGTMLPDELLGEIFSGFCIGK